MKLLLVLLLFLFISPMASSQSSTWSVALGVFKPVPFGNNFMHDKTISDKGYVGFGGAELSLDRRFKNNLTIGIGLNTSVYRLSFSDLTVIGFRPQIKAGYLIPFYGFSISSGAGIGLAHWQFHSPDTEYIDENGNIYVIKNDRTDNGISFVASVALLFRNKKKISYFLKAGYSFTRFGKPTAGELDTNFNRNIHIFEPGAGIVWNFGKP